MKNLKTGFVLGKFCPLHKGHQYLIDTARKWVERLYIVVDNIMDDVIPVSQRMKWVRQEYPDAVVLTQHAPLPQSPVETPLFWDIWRETLLSLLPEKIDVVFASETYGERLARELQADFVMVDSERLHIPISATSIRHSLITNWNFLADAAKADMMTTVCVFGPESTGKSTLTKRLAEHYGVPYVPEYAETVIRARRSTASDASQRGNGDLSFDDMELIVQGHHELIQDTIVSKRPPLLFVDTDAITSKIWSNELFGKESPIIEDFIRRQHFSHYLLLDVDLPWKDDVHRYRPNKRKEFFDKCLHELMLRGLPFHVIRGFGEKRILNAISVVDEIIDKKKNKNEE